MPPTTQAGGASEGGVSPASVEPLIPAASACKTAGLAGSASVSDSNDLTPVAQHVATYAQANVVQVTTELILAAIDLHRLHKLSFWDALILRSARSAGCSVVFSEDMKHGQNYEGVVIENPFSR